VVWVPMRSPGSEVRSVLGSAPGSVVTLSVPSPTPTTPTGGPQ
jgi:NADH-quinone oxidoreductase subunit G